MIPILYAPDTDKFDNDGLGTLADTISCTVTEERNGTFELELTYPVAGILYDEIKPDRIIKAKAHDYGEDQLFRIYRVTRPINQVVTVNAEHISYELAGNPVLDFQASGSAQAVLSALMDRAVFPHKFRVVSDISGSSNSVNLPGPQNVRAVMGGIDGSILDTFGGEYEWDNYTVYLHASRGENRGVSIEYGKNLTDLTQEEAIDSTYTCVIPYAKTSDNGTDTYHYIEGVPYVNAPNADRYARPKALMVDFSDKFQAEGDEQPEITSEALQEYAQKYIKDNDVGVPKVSLTVKYIPLDTLPEYAGNPLLERVSLCDTVAVRFPALGVDAESKVIKITYNTLQERVDEAELGDSRSNFVDSYTQLEQDVKKAPQNMKSIIQGAISNATSLITGVRGGHVVIKTDADGKPQEILIMDTDDTATATKIWRWNVNGFGYSGHGINGPYDTAITMDGQIVADFIATGTLNAAEVNVENLKAESITSGLLTSKDGETTYNLDNGVITNRNGGSGELSISSGTINITYTRTDGTNYNVSIGPYAWYWRYNNNMRGSVMVDSDGVQISATRLVADENITANSNLIAGQNLIVSGSTIQKRSATIDGTTIQYLGW